jgi:hypothetical protein
MHSDRNAKAREAHLRSARAYVESARAPRPSTARAPRHVRAGFGAGACPICLDDDPPPIPTGCACRGNAGKAHVECIAKFASGASKTGRWDAWLMCETCKQRYTGPAFARLVAILAESAKTAQRGSKGSIYSRGASAILLVDEGKLAESERLLRGVLGEAREALGEESDATLFYAAILALALSKQLKHADAAAVYRELARLHEKKHGADHPKTMETACLLASSLSGLGKHAESIEILRGAVNRSVALNSAETLVTARQLLASALEEKARSDPATARGAIAEALAIHREVLAAQTLVLGPDHGRTVETEGRIAADLCKLRQEAEAVPIMRRVLEAQKQTNGSEHPDTLVTAGNLALALCALSEFAEAAEILDWTVPISVRVLGANHPSTVDHVALRRRCTLALGKTKRAPPKSAPMSDAEFAAAEARARQAEAELLAMLNNEEGAGKSSGKKKK